MKIALVNVFTGTGVLFGFFFKNEIGFKMHLKLHYFLHFLKWVGHFDVEVEV